MASLFTTENVREQIVVTHAKASVDVHIHSRYVLSLPDSKGYKVFELKQCFE